MTDNIETRMLCLLLMTMGVVAMRASASEVSPDVTPHVEMVGNPYQAKYPSGPHIYARNIWDLCAIDGELLVGAGNSSNIGPSPNAGPVPLFAYSPSNGQFRIVFTVDDEQIDVFRVCGGKLYIPGHDPRESWEFGNFYRLEGKDAWRKHRNIPNGIHNYDMISFDGALFAGLGTPKGAAVAVSKDSGVTWKNAVVANTRIYAFMAVKQELYATGLIPSEDSHKRSSERGIKATTGVFQYDGKVAFQPRNDLGPRQLFPGIAIKPNVDARIARAVSFKDSAAYVGAYCHNDHQFIPFGAFVAELLKAGSISIHPVPLPKSSRAWDLLCDDNVLYVLADSPDAEGTIVRVAASTDGVHWEEIMHFRAKTFARSFALLDGDFYFGLGCEVMDAKKWTMAELLPETGQILRVKKSYWERPKPRVGK